MQCGLDGRIGIVALAGCRGGRSSRNRGSGNHRSTILGNPDTVVIAFDLDLRQPCFIQQGGQIANHVLIDFQLFHKSS